MNTSNHKRVRDNDLAFDSLGPARSFATEMVAIWALPCPVNHLRNVESLSPLALHVQRLTGPDTFGDGGERPRACCPIAKKHLDAPKEYPTPSQATLRTYRAYIARLYTSRILRRSTSRTPRGRKEAT